MTAKQAGVKEDQKPKLGQRYRPLRDEVLDEVRTQILDGRLAPGALINESALAAELGVSRLPVREAIRQLESAGLVTSVPRRGVRVAHLDVSEYAVAHQIRLALELLAVRLTVERHDEEVLDALGNMVETGRQAAKKSDGTTLRRLNAEFHDLLSRGSGSPMLISLVATVRHQTRHLAGGLRSADELSWDEHAAIIEAVVAGRTRDAVTLMRRHLNDRHAVTLASGSASAPTSSAD
jgi:GntR family transcriptional regulator, rspAB operon transcriptional repressor